MVRGIITTILQKNWGVVILKFQRQIHIPFQETRCLNLFNETDKQKHVLI